MVELYMSDKDDKPKVAFLTIDETARLCGRGRAAFIKLIYRGLMPDANYRTKSKVMQKGEKRGEKIPGTRIYSKDFLVPKLVSIFKGISQGKSISMEQRKALSDAFIAEKNYFETEY